MKLNNVTDIEGFFSVVDKCKGKVILVSDDMRLNLKSKLTQYFSLAKLFNDGAIQEMTIETDNPDDTHLMLDFMMRQ